MSLPGSSRLIDAPRLQMRRVPLRGPITANLVGTWINRLLFLSAEDNHLPIIIDIDSTGGFGSDALSILRTMDRLACPVLTFSYGLVRGTAALIAAHGARGFRTASPTAQFSFAPSTNGKDPGLCEQSREMPGELLAMLARDVRRPEQEIIGWLENGIEFTPQQAVDIGLIDVIANAPVIPPAAG